MNNVDISDQLRTVYRYYRWMRKQKWWWSIAFWSLQMMQTNAYIIYCKYHKIHLKDQISWYKFIENIALTWLDEVKYGLKRQSSSRSQSVPIDPQRSLSRRSARITLYRSSTSSTTIIVTVVPAYKTSLRTSTSTSKIMKVVDLTLDPVNGDFRCG